MAGFCFLDLLQDPKAICNNSTLHCSFLIKKMGGRYFIALSLMFQLIWIAVSQAIYGTPFKHSRQQINT
jgi:hypothetical protein